MLRFLEGIMMSKGNGNQPDTCLVKCRLEPGMFKGEWLVFLDAINPENQQELKVQLFADQREVARIQGTPKKNQPAWGWLRVSLVKAKNGLAQVVLPQPATPVGETVFVKKELVDLKGHDLLRSSDRKGHPGSAFDDRSLARPKPV